MDNSVKILCECPFQKPFSNWYIIVNDAAPVPNSGLFMITLKASCKISSLVTSKFLNPSYVNSCQTLFGIISLNKVWIPLWKKFWVVTKIKVNVNNKQGINHWYDDVPKTNGIDKIEEPHAFREFVRKTQVIIPARIILKKFFLILLEVLLKDWAIQRGNINVNHAPA